MQLTLEGNPAELADFCKSVGRQEMQAEAWQERAKSPNLPQKPFDGIIYPEGKSIAELDRLTKPRKKNDLSPEYRAIVYPLIDQGLNSHQIETILIEEHDIKDCGWKRITAVMAARARVKGKDAIKSQADISLPSEPAKPAKSSQDKPARILSDTDALILEWHEAGCFDLDISQRLRQMDVSMSPIKVGQRIKELMA